MSIFTKILNGNVIPRRILLGAAAVAVLQTAAIGWMVADRIHLLKTGREIVLPIIPVDPRDLFKGEYVRLSFPVSIVPDAALPSAGTKTRQGEPVQVTLERYGEEWKPVAASSAPNGADRITLQARRAFNWASRGGTAVNYGIERYYVPEGQGLALEKLAMTSKLAAIVAVDAKGRSAIKGLIVDGKKVYDEPLW